MRTKNILVISLNILMLNGCGIHKKYTNPDINTEGLYREYGPIDNYTTNFAQVKWFQVFTDPYLQSLINIAIENNTDLLVSKLRIEQAEAALKSAKLAFLPSFNLGLQGGLSSYDTKKAQYAYSLPVMASWEIDIFGKINNAKQKAKANLLQSQEYQNAVQTWLVATVANTYYTLLMLDKQHEISQQTLLIWEENLRVTKELKKAGMTNDAAVSQTAANCLAIEASIKELERQIYDVENNLCILLAMNPTELERGHINDFWIDETVIKTGVPAQLLTNRSDIRAAEYALEQAYYNIAEVRSSFYPSLTLSGSAGWTNQVSSYIINPSKLLASAMGSLTQPIFNAGTNRARLKIAKSDAEITYLQYEQAILNAGGEVISALKQMETAYDKLTYRDQQIMHLEQAVKSSELLMKHTSITYLEVLTAQQTLLSAQLSDIADQFELIQGTINLFHALGGGSK